MVTDPIILLFFVGATALLIISPGPVVSLVIAETLSRGARYAIVALMGVECAALIHLTLYNLGFIWLIESTPPSFFDFIRYGGAAFLFYLAYQRYHEPVAPLDTNVQAAHTKSKAFSTGFLIALTNPKSIIFYAVFFPQFVDPMRDIPRQLIELSIAFFVTGILLDAVWIIAAHKARTWFSSSGKIGYINKVASVVLLFAALLMIFINQ